MEAKERHIYVIGEDDFNRREMEELAEQPGYQHYRFHDLLSYEELGQTGGTSFNDLLDKARNHLQNVDTPIDAIMTFWDFPAQTLAPLLNQEFGLPRSDVNVLEKCEHKYWARLLQREHVPQATPKFAAVDPFDKQQALPDLDFPFWLKPIKSFSSYLAFKIENLDDYHRALEEIRANIDSVAVPFNEMLEHLDLPEDIRQYNGYWCIAEEVIKGEQCTVEGYCFDGEVHVHGIIDSVVEVGRSSFARYQYPSHLPRGVQQRMVEITEKLMRGIGYKLGDFNIEFFYERDTDQLSLLEVNPRISQSHSEMFKKVDGITNQAIPVALALGERPEFPHGQGSSAMAGKFFLRAHADALVEDVPSPENIRAIKQRFPDVEVKVQAKAGRRLSEDKLHDSYSFELAQLFLGAEGEEQLLAKYRECVGMLKFRLQGTDEEVSKLAGEQYQPSVDRPAL